MNPLADNPLLIRDDFARSVVQLWEPLKAHFSPGRARVNVGQPSAHFTQAAAELEGFARPLFGLAPLAAGDLPFDDWAMLREGFANGSDPAHPEYWGDVFDRDQRLVESAAIGFGLMLARDRLWTPLAEPQRNNLARWLESCQRRRVADNNWHFFHVLGSLGLERCGVEHDLSVREAALDRLESFYIADGWYADGPGRQFDHYIPFAMHFYGLLYAATANDDEERCERFRERARLFAREFRDWFDHDGASMAFGRSMTYRFAQSAFWAALAFADEEALPWGEVRGLWARNLRWWGERDYFDRDGIMPVGYCYPNQNMCEIYNSPGSPYWCMKAFLPLALAPDSPFWTAEEVEKQETAGALTRSQVTGMLNFEAGGSRVMLSSCNENLKGLNRCEEKYGKFAYSTALGFSVDPDPTGFVTNSFDNMIALSRDGRHFVTRNALDEVLMGDDWLWCRWQPEEGLTVETWLLARAPWHLRAHKILCDRKYFATEGGFNVRRTDADPETATSNGRAWVRTEDAFSAAVDLTPARRDAWIRRAHPNSSLYFPQTWVPHLGAEVSAGTSWLVGAFAASTRPDDADLWLAGIPDAPPTETLESMLSEGTVPAGTRFKADPPAPFPP